VEAAARALGLAYLRDVLSLRSGTEWPEEILGLIDQADVFQLFWSEAARQSKEVEREWRHALELATQSPGRSHFIRPVYWSEPQPEIPDELRHLHFRYEPGLAS
jgi:hypothetical protein